MRTVRFQAFLLPLCIGLLLSGGCERPAPKPQPPSAHFGLLHHGQTTTWDMGRNGKLMVVVWADCTAGGGGRSGKAAADPVRGIMELSDGRTLDIQCDTLDGKIGATTINGSKYDLANGSIFLTYTQEQPIRVVQLKRHPEHQGQVNEYLQGLAENDPDVSPFVRQAGRKK